ncbi:MAG: PAS domain S-box protein [Hormoscilla sp.]
MIDILESITDAIFVLDQQWRFAYLNRQAESLWQRTTEELLGKNIWQEFPETVGEPCYQEYQKARSQQTPVTFDSYNPSLDRWFEVRAFPSAEGLLVQWRDITDRKRTEEALRQNEARNQAFLKVLPDVMFRINRDGTYLDAIASYGNKLLLPPPELIGKKVREVLPPDLADRMMHYIEQALVTDIIQIFEYQLLVKGSLRDREQRVIKSGTDEVMTIARDITDRKQAEQTVVQQAQIIDQIHDAVITCDLNGMVTSWNKGAEKMYGYGESEAIGKHISFIYPPDQQEFLQTQVLAPVLQKGSHEVETPKIKKSGEKFWTHVYLTLLRDAKGKVIGIISSGNDITERKQAKETLQESEQFLRSIYDGVETCIFVVDVGADGNFYYAGVNPAHARLTGIPSEQWQGKTPQQLLPAAVAEGIEERYLNCLRGGKTILYEEYLPLRGINTWWQTTLTPLRDGRGRIYRLVGTSTNITVRKQTESALQQSEAQLREQANQLELTLQELRATQSQLVQNQTMSSLGQLVAGVAHEINNPVNFIYGNVVYAKEYALDLMRLVNLYTQHYPQPVPEIEAATDEIDIDFIAADLHKLLDSMKVGAERIRNIVLSLRNFSRLDEDGLKAVDIHEGIDNTLLIVQHRLHPQPTGRDREIQVIKEYGNLPSVECYPGQLNQVFMNVINNAIDALSDSFAISKKAGKKSGDGGDGSEMQKTPRIWICTEVLKKHARVVIKIRDNGPGIAEDILSRIYDPFFTTKPVGEGRGLGLSMSHKIIVEKHLGILNCTSQPGVGTEFAIELPIFRRHK